MPEYNILVVEDEAIVAADLQRRLRNLGYGIAGQAVSGEEAIREADKKRPDLVLMDIVLKGQMDGVAAAEQIRSRFDVPVIYVTAYADDVTLERAKDTAPGGYLLKPYREKDLKATIEMALHKHQMGRQLKESQRWLASVLKSIGDAVIATDIEGRVSFINPLAEALSGWRQEEALGKDLADIFKIMNDEARTLADDPVTVALRDKVPIDLGDRMVLIARSGSEKPVCGAASPIFDDLGDVAGVVLIFRDITEQKELEKALIEHRDNLERMVKERTEELSDTITKLEKEIAERKRAEDSEKALVRERDEILAHLWLVLKHMPIGCILLDRDFKITYSNPAAEDILGFAGEETLIGVLHENQAIAPSSLGPEVEELLHQVIAGKTTSRQINKTVARDGRTITCEWYNTPLFDVRGELIGLLCMVLDISESKRAEEEKEKLAAQLRRAQKLEAIGTLAGGIAHDFNNILGIIMGYAGLAELESPENQKARQHLKEALGACHRAKELVRQILSFSRTEDTLERRLLDIRPIIKEITKFLKASLPSTIEIRQNIASQSGTVLAHATQIHQVLTNLCMNAAHAMETTGGILEVSLTDVDPDPATLSPHSNLRSGPHVRLTVADTGHGMDSATLERIFDPYFTTKELAKGTGLGLAVVHGIVKSHEGAITVYSEEGKGSTFHVYLPRIDRVAKTLEEPSSPIPRGAERILLVDDEAHLLNIWQKTLESLGYNVMSRTSCLEALESFRLHPDYFDLVITDYTMPHMNGIDLTRQMMRIRPDIPVILCTGLKARTLDAKMKEAGFRSLLMKPLELRDTAEAIRAALDEK
jgi:PAS domain S-box-containing protein